MKITGGVTVYTCDHCKKKYFVRSACEKHEDFCDSNPKNLKACMGCIFLEETKVEYSIDTCGGYGPDTRKSNGFRCSQKNQLLYPLKVERLGLPDKYPETFEEQEPMPKECNLRKEYEI